MTGVVNRLRMLAEMLPPDQLALVDNHQELRYTDVIARVSRFSEWLKSQQCRTVAFRLENSVDWVTLDLACQETGVVSIPLPGFFSDAQVEACIKASGTDTLILPDSASAESVYPALRSKLDVQAFLPGVRIQAWKLATPRDRAENTMPLGTQKVTFTSGSTGTPKGVCLSLSHQWQIAQSLADRIGIVHPRHLCLLPLSTLLENIAGVYSPLICGGTVLLPDEQMRGMLGSSKIDVNALLGCISSQQPHTMILIPQLLTLLVRAVQKGWQPPKTLRFIAVGGGKVSQQLLKSAHKHGLPVYQGYGLSECGSVVSLNTPFDDPERSVGAVLPHCQVRVEAQEIVVYGASFLGYLGESDSWYPKAVRTGDLGTIQSQHLFVSGRKKNILISSFGRNISPEWVESELLARPLLQQCVVFGDEQPHLGALVSAPEQISDTQISEWIHEVNDSLPDYARVVKWQRVKDGFQDCFTANGKLLRDRVLQRYQPEIQALFSRSRLAISA